jgi:hypothetical protein
MFESVEKIAIPPSYNFYIDCSANPLDMLRFYMSKVESSK